MTTSKTGSVLTREKKRYRFLHSLSVVLKGVYGQFVHGCPQASTRPLGRRQAPDGTRGDRARQVAGLPGRRRRPSHAAGLRDRPRELQDLVRQAWFSADAGHAGGRRGLSGGSRRGLRAAHTAPPCRRHRVRVWCRRGAAGHQASGDPRDAPRDRPQAWGASASGSRADNWRGQAAVSCMRA